jgi:hypothetical protein
VNTVILYAFTLPIMNWLLLIVLGISFTLSEFFVIFYAYKTTKIDPTDNTVYEYREALTN